MIPIDLYTRFSYKYVGLLYCQAEMYAGRIASFACCLLVSHGKYANGTDGQRTDGGTDARQLHYAFRCQRNKHVLYIVPCHIRVLFQLHLIS